MELYIKDQKKYYINDNQIRSPLWCITSLSSETVAIYNKKYKIQNYNGNFSLKISSITYNNEYQLYYKDKLLLSSIYREPELYMAMERLLSGINLDRLFFENKFKKEEFMEFLQYLYWDIPKSSLWLIKQFRKEFQNSNADLNPLNMYIIKRGNFFTMYHGQQEVRELYSSSLELIHAIKVLTIQGIGTKELGDRFAEDYQNFRKFILNSSDESIIAWMNQNKNLGKIKKKS